MRLRSLSVAGFRGFNSPRKIEFDDRLTVISAPNSHGKTSITEAFELLIYGQTSKVATAESKDEYKDSYRNRHYAPEDVPYVEACCADSDETEITLRVELHESGIKRFLDGEPVDAWPFEAELANAARPFVVQHALKSLLLAAPTDRFKGFARLLGLHEVDLVQQSLVNLCTKPDSHLPHQAKKLLEELDLFVGRLMSIKETTPAGKSLAKGSAGIDDAFAKLQQRGQKLVGEPLEGEELLAGLVTLRNAAAAKVYSGSVKVGELSTPDQGRLSAATLRIQGFAAKETIDEYVRLAAGGATDRLRNELSLLGIGLELVGESPERCPLCQQGLGETQRAEMHARHESLVEEVGTGPDLDLVRTQVATRLQQLVQDVEAHAQLLSSRSTELINANTPENSKKISGLIGEGHEDELFLIAAAGTAIGPHHKKLNEAATAVSLAAKVCSDAIHQKAENVAQVEELVRVTAGYLSAATAYDGVVAEVESTLEEPSRLLQAAVDALAGTTELSLLIEVLGNRHNLGRATRIREVLQSLKALRKHVDQAVGQTMEDAFSNELTQAVMGWYKRIRTTGDPDVHFSGFSMERTKTGKFKSRRVRVAAHSYGVELASAVSSLSESKLNALGLCMSIATALGSPGPWDFIILDDPIQSWDDDHEIQFVEVVRRLVEEEDRQVILMSHRDSWIDQVVMGCRSLNGRRYHIGGYSQDGPVITGGAWAGVDQRLKEALGIASDLSASPVRLQQAEEELRITASQLAAEAAKVKLGRPVGAHNLNKDRVRAILTEAGCDARLVDRVVATFNTTDDAHHAPKGYEPNRERIRQYHGALCDLKNWIRKP